MRMSRDTGGGAPGFCIAPPTLIRGVRLLHQEAGLLSLGNETGHVRHLQEEELMDPHLSRPHPSALALSTAGRGKGNWCPKLGVPKFPPSCSPPLGWDFHLSLL